MDSTSSGRAISNHSYSLLLAIVAPFRLTPKMTRSPSLSLALPLLLSLSRSLRLSLYPSLPLSLFFWFSLSSLSVHICTPAHAARTCMTRVCLSCLLGLTEPSRARTEREGSLHRGLLLRQRVLRGPVLDSLESCGVSSGGREEEAPSLPPFVSLLGSLAVC